jgi:hypothetical protein
MTQSTPYRYQFLSRHLREHCRSLPGNPVVAFPLLSLLLGAGVSPLWAEAQVSDSNGVVAPETHDYPKFMDAGDALARKTAPPAKRSPLLFTLYASHLALELLDARSTQQAVANGRAREGNPLLEPFATNTAALTVTKLGMAAGIIFATDRLYRHHPLFAMVILGTINTGYIILLQRSYARFGSH